MTPQRDRAGPPTDPSVPSEKARILIVDDTDANRMVFETVLSELGHEIVPASSGQEALRLAWTQEFAVILMDVRMPMMDGFETVELLRSREKCCFTPIIFMSAHETKLMHVTKGYSAGAIDYLFSPVNPDILALKVQGFVDLWRRSKALRTRADELTRINHALQSQIAATSGLEELKRTARALSEALRKLQEDTASPYR